MNLNILLCFLFAVINTAGCNTIKREAAKTTKKLKEGGSHGSTFILLGGDDDEGGDDEGGYDVNNNDTASGSGSGSGWVVTEVGSGGVITEVGSGGIENTIGSGEVVTEKGSGDDDNEPGDVVSTEHSETTTPLTIHRTVPLATKTTSVNIFPTTKSITIEDTTEALTTTITERTMPQTNVSNTTVGTMETTKLINSKKSKFIDVVYSGACEMNNVVPRPIEEYKTALQRFDFIYLVKKHPNGVFSIIFSVERGELKFTDSDYLRINAPLSCGCFASAMNARYLIGGRLQDGKLVIDEDIPLYKVTSMKQLLSIVQV